MKHGWWLGGMVRRYHNDTPIHRTSTSIRRYIDRYEAWDELMSRWVDETIKPMNETMQFGDKQNMGVGETIVNMMSWWVDESINETWQFGDMVFMGANESVSGGVDERSVLTWRHGDMMHESFRVSHTFDRRVGRRIYLKAAPKQSPHRARTPVHVCMLVCMGACLLVYSCMLQYVWMEDALLAHVHGLHATHVVAPSAIVETVLCGQIVKTWSWWNLRKIFSKRFPKSKICGCKIRPSWTSSVQSFSLWTGHSQWRRWWWGIIFIHVFLVRQTIMTMMLTMMSTAMTTTRSMTTASTTRAKVMPWDDVEDDVCRWWWRLSMLCGWRNLWFFPVDTCHIYADKHVRTRYPYMFLYSFSLATGKWWWTNPLFMILSPTIKSKWWTNPIFCVWLAGWNINIQSLSHSTNYYQPRRWWWRFILSFTWAWDCKRSCRWC